MKYGGVGGWRAIKRISRDANIAEGVAPYRYRTRYSNTRTRANSSKHENLGPEWATLLHQVKASVDAMREFHSNGITLAQQEDLQRTLVQLEKLVDNALAARPGIWAALFLGERTWVTSTQPEIQVLLATTTGQYQRLLKLARSRSKAIEKENKKINAFVAKFDARYVDPIREQVSKDDLAILDRYEAFANSANNTSPSDWKEIVKHRKRILPALSAHVVAAVDLFQRYKDVSFPSVEYNLPQRLVVVGDLRLDLSGPSPKHARKITPVEP